MFSAAPISGSIHAFRPGNARIICHVDPIVPGILIYDRPTNGTEAKFSLPYSLAVAAHAGKAGIAEFTLDEGPDANILSIMERVSVLTDEALPKGPSGSSVSSRIRIELEDGRCFERFQEFAPGSASAPLSDDAVRGKFDECLFPISLNAASALFNSLVEASADTVFSDYIDQLVPSPMVVAGQTN